MKRFTLIIALGIASTSVGRSSAQILDAAYSNPWPGYDHKTEAKTTGTVESIRRGYRSTNTGWLLAVSGTIIPIVAATSMDSGPGVVAGFLGLYVGPSIGNLYAGDVGRGLGGIGLRVVGTLAMAVGVGDLFDDSDDNDALAAAGLAAFVGASLWNFASISTSVHEYNRRRSATLEVAPLVYRSGGGGISARLVF